MLHMIIFVLYDHMMINRYDLNKLLSYTMYSRCKPFPCQFGTGESQFGGLEINWE